MKIKLSTLFTLVAILFFMASINYWRLVATRIDGAEGFPFLLLKTSSLLVFVFCFIFVIKNIQEYPFKGVHLVCFLWYVFMPVVVFFNRGQFSDYFFTLLWPLLFQTSYLLIIYNVNYIHVLRRLFIVIFIVGFFLFLMGTRMAEGEQTNTIFFSL
ncbi:hypothetical protein LJC72_12710, partial [Bacteroides sp. OttesenSCG-928-D19]|nr:hypothetical protein [Bacteroides sp. OttesenSCG-928-D19]